MWTSLKEPFIVFVEDCEYCLVEIRLTVLGFFFFFGFILLCRCFCLYSKDFNNLNDFQM